VRKERICYVLPEYRTDASSHYYHLYELIEDLGKELDVRVFVEYAKEKPTFANAKGVYVQRLHFLPLRMLERFAVFLAFRARGCRKFYVHQARGSAIIASAVTRLTAGKTFFWYCGWMIGEEHKTTLFDVCLKAVDYLVTGNRTMAEYYHKTFNVPNEKIRIMPNWVNLQRFDAKRFIKEEAREKKVVLFVHWLSERKGAQHLAQIAEDVDAVFIVVGDGPYREKLEAEIKEKNLGERMKLVGEVPNTKIPEYFAAADVFIMPSMEEGFPRVLLEAMAMGVPFVASDVGGVRDILTEQQQKFVVPAGDVGCFTEKLKKLLQDGALRKDLKAEGEKKVLEYSKEKVVKRFLEAIR
jgi:glycosyltransferase involved in cell wall biosynthesis